MGRPSKYPAEFRQETVRQALLEWFRTATGPDGRVAASVQAMTEDDARDVAAEILSLEYRLRSDA